MGQAASDGTPSKEGVRLLIVPATRQCFICWKNLGGVKLGVK